MRQQVRALVREAGDLMDRGERSAAAARLQQAQALWPEPSIDYNLGIVYAELGQHPQAAQVLQRFLATANRGAVLRERLDDAQRRLDTYQHTLARLSVKVVVPAGAGAAAMSIDKDVPISVPLPLPLWLTAGPHSVKVAATGANDFVVQVDLEPGTLRQLSAELLPAASLSAVVPAVPELWHAVERPSPPLYKKWWFWTAIGSGTASIITIGLLAAGASGRFSHPAAGSDLDPVDVGR